jgi:hypothetical protein
MAARARQPIAASYVYLPGLSVVYLVVHVSSQFYNEILCKLYDNSSV